MAKDYQKEILKVLEKISAALENKLPIKTSPDGRFVDNGDGTISDTKLRLMWQKTGSEENLTFSNAEEYCKNSKLAGNNDWRLPTIEELESLVDRTKFKPAIISDLFSVKTDDWYWSATEYKGNSDGAWLVYFGSGGVYWYDRSSYNYVRPVRQY